MAKGQTIGLLNFGLGGDDSELQKLWEKQKKQAEELQAIYRSVGIGATKEQAASFKSVLDEQRKSAINQLKISEAQRKSEEQAIIAKHKMAAEAERVRILTRNSDLMGVKIQDQVNSANEKSMLNQQRKLALEEKVTQEKKKTLAEQVRIDSLNRQNEQKSLLGQQRLLTEIQRTEAAKKRAALVGVQGQNSYANAIGLTNKTMFSQYNIMQQLSAAAGIYFSIYQAGAFVKELAMVSGEFEKQRLSLAAIIQDQEASTKIFNQIKDLAVYSPFNFKELTDYAKQLSAFSIPTNEIFDTMKSLADISAGLGVDMNRIILAYGQVRSASVLRGQELRQFTEAGIPLVDELAKKFSELSGEVVKAGDVFEKISNREVPFAMIKDIFTEMTSEGGKFYEMQEIQATSLAGMISNLRDAYDILLDSIGSANSDMLKGAVKGLTDVMENWEKYWDILKGIIIAYGSYKAVLITAAAAQKGLALASTIQQFIQLTKVVRTSTAALAALNMAGLTSPLAAVAVFVGAVTALGYGIYKLSSYTTEFENASKDLQTSLSQEELALSVLVGRLKNATEGTDEYGKAKNAINSKYGEYLKNLGLEAESLVSSKEAYALLTEEIQKHTRERLHSQYVEEASTEAGQRIGKEYGKIIKQLKQDVGAINYPDVLAAIKSMISESDINTSDLAEKFENIGLNWKEYSSSVYSILSQNYILAQKTKEFNDIFSTVGVAVGGKAVASELSFTTEEINKAIDRLPNFSEELKKKIKVTDVNQSFQEIRKSAISALESWQEKMKEMLAAPSLFKEADRKSAEENVKLYEEFVKILGGKEEKGGSKKDPVAEKIKNQISLLKNLKDEYEKLIKAGKSEDQAATFLAGLPSFEGLDPRKYDQYMKDISDRLQKSGSKEQISILKDLLIGKDKDIISKEIDRITKEAGDKVKEVERELSKYKERYSLYEQIFGMTGDKGQAAKIAFGNLDIVKTLKERIQEEISKTDNAEFKIKLQEQLIEMEDLESLDFAKGLAELIKETQTTEDKITEIVRDGEEQRRKIREQYGETDAANTLIDASLKRQKGQINELESESLKLTPLYMQLFGDISSYGSIALNAIIKKTEDLLALISETPKSTGGTYTVDVDGKSIGITEADIAKITKKLGELKKEAGATNPFKMLTENIKEFKSAEDDVAKGVALGKIGSSISAIGGIAQQVGGDLANMFSALGEEDTADTIGFITEMAGSLANIGAGIASGNPIQVIQGIIGGITSIATHHDKMLDRAIEKSRLEVKKLENAYSDLERIISRQLGGVTEKQFKQMRSNLVDQRRELEKQKRAEQDKKKSDKSAIADYEAQIKELDDQIKYFAEDMAKTMYDIDIKGWASDISKSIVDAFASGEDAAKAFDQTVAGIMKNVIQNMISLAVIEPAMEQVREYLFGKNGRGGIMGDGQITKEEAGGLVSVLHGLKDSIAQGKEIWDFVNDAAKEVGLDLTDTAKKDTLGASIQALTEDTGNLLASYLNAMRADLAAQRAMVERIANSLPTSTEWFAQVQAKLVAIEVNTRQTAESNSEIKVVSENMYKILKSVTTPGSATKINI